MLRRQSSAGFVRCRVKLPSANQQPVEKCRGAARWSESAGALASGPINRRMTNGPNGLHTAHCQQRRVKALTRAIPREFR